MIRISAWVVFMAALLLAACQTDHGGTTQAVVAPVKNVAPTPVPVTGMGVLLSGWVNGGVAAGMNDADRMKNRQAEARAANAPIGQQVTWNNPANGDSGAIIVVRDGYSPTGAYCRDYRQNVTIGGQSQQGQVKACQQPDGGWKVP